MGSSKGGNGSKSVDFVLVLHIHVEQASLAFRGPSRRGELPTAGHRIGVGMELLVELL